MPGGVFVVSGTNNYSQAGIYPVNVDVTLNSSLGGNVAHIKTSATIAEAALSSQGVAVTGTAGSSLQNVVVATVIDANPHPILANFSAMIDWGDGSQPTPGILQVASNGTLQVLGSHVYTSAGNFFITTTVRDSNSAGEVLDATTTASSSASIGVPPPPPVLTPGFVAGLYRTDLRREAAGFEISYWNDVLASGVSQLMVAYFVEISPEHRMLQITDTYNSLLGRNPTFAETMNALNSLESGGTLKQLRASILASDEYFQNRAGGDKATLLQTISIDVLGQPLPTDKQNYYTWVFNTTAKREEAVLSLLNSNEVLDAQVQNFFQQVLGRGAAPVDVSAGESFLRGGGTEDLYRALLLSSEEGIQRNSAG
jgi:hypothetical protein